MRINWRTALALRLPDLSTMTVRVCLMRSLDEDQTLRLDAVLILAPLHPAVCDIGAIALAGHRGFFEA
jgi:hypothetical protein